MSRYIDADKLCEGRVNNDPVVIAAKCEPTADVEHVRHGCWIYIGRDKYYNFFVCSECRERIKNPSYETTGIVKIRFPYSHCGAKMDGKEKER